ncbi:MULTISPECIES: sugar kinase [unclassified Mycolicibacterium]|uniref:sugar kinase n=1 Tax=unclassified Mycolicibacterium TaxID=2636767 RepID=UPI001F4C5243|nr:sugar kinase [Mycolicibacterium sp. YH-1]UNB52060.1 sugar kinase [Mycolicibacterium sp. YH-1]
MTTPVRVLSVGECMIEVRFRDAAAATVSFGGDTANVAIYLSHYGAPRGIDVSYLTSVGDDLHSQRMVLWLKQKRVSTRTVQVRLGGKVGLYLIDNTADGERIFTYYRGDSAARQLFTGAAATAAAVEAIHDADWVYLSGISVAILTPDARVVLLQALDAVRERGVRVVFDSNYRPALWRDTETARTVTTEFLRRTDVALPTAVDDRDLFGDLDEQATANRLHQLGVPEVVVKLGPQGCLVSSGGQRRHLPISGSGHAVDTTAAGDSFNAGYLFGRIRGAGPAEAAGIAARLAAAVVSHPGAVIDPGHLPEIDAEEAIS